VRDLYKEKFKHLDMYSRYLSNLMNGNFVNFNVCSYYGDNTFLNLAMTYFQSMCVQSFEELKSYPKVLRRCFQVMEVFFRYYLELLFEHFPPDIIAHIMEFLRQGLVFSTQSDIVSDSCNMLDQLNQLSVKAIENSKATNMV
jgi:hypothetical protein